MKLKAYDFGTRPFPSNFDVIRSVTLNKTDLEGGNNKFYTIEAHASKDTNFRLYSRYGRVGAHGVEEERWPDQNEVSLLDAFESLKAEKTSKRKGYVEVKLAETKVGSSATAGKILSDDVAVKGTLPKGTGTKSKLHPTVSRLVERLYAEAGQAVRKQLSGTLQATKENPLGTLTLSQIDEGRSILQEIQTFLARSKSHLNSIEPDLIKLSSKFYSAIPQEMHKRPRPTSGREAMDAWLSQMAINTAQKCDDQEELLQLLADVKGMVGGFATDDITAKYDQIGCKFDPTDAATFTKIKDFHTRSRSGHHNWRVDIKNIWKVAVKGQADRNVPTMQKIGNVQPLFHGSRPANILGISKHGLLMRPPGAYVTGSCFGNGLYFADQASKSEQYAMARFGGGSGNGDTYFMFVVDVALGKIKRYQDPQERLTKPPSGYDSVQGEKGNYLLHNEYVTYSTSQNILQYLIEFGAH